MHHRRAVRPPTSWSKAIACAAVLSLGLAAGAAAAPATAAPLAGVVSAAPSTASGMDGARAGLERILGTDIASRFDLATLPATGADRFEVKAGTGSRILISATTPATALRALNVYLESRGQSVNYDARNVSTDPSVFTAPATPLTGTADVAHRFYGNDTEDGYTGPYRSFDEWATMIDDLAAQGYNEIFMPVGSEAVYLDVLQQFGYTESEARAWIPAPSHQPWWLLQNMSSYPAGITQQGVAERAALGKRIADRMRELGITPVLPGFYETVPHGFGAKHPGVNTVVATASWQGFTRSEWLDPNTELFGQMATAFYASSKQRLGSSSMYKMDVLHEGGQAGTVDVTPASTRIQDALQAAHPGALWVLLGWQNNPPAKVLAGVNPKTTFIVDGLSDRYNPAPNRESSFQGVPYAFGSIWNFGGDTAMGAQINTWSKRYWAMRNKADSTLDGVAAIPEGGLNNAAALEYLGDLAWTHTPIDNAAWWEQWTYQRYGVKNASANTAWKTIAETAYSLDENDGLSEPQDTLYDAQPSFTANTASAWSPTKATYDLEAFATAVQPLLDAAPEAKNSAAYRRDLMDVSRQALTNTARQMLPRISKAYNLRDLKAYDDLTAQWLKNMDLLDRLAGTDSISLLGRMLDDARNAGTTDAEKDLFEKSQKVIVSTWAEKGPSTSGQLRDYAGRDYQGLIRHLYLPRWKQFFADQRLVLSSNGATKAPVRDWWTEAQPWLSSTDRTGVYSTPQGDVVELAGEAVKAVHDSLSLTVTDPPPPGGGTSYLSDLTFSDQELDPAFGPIERDTEVGNAASGDGKPITLNGTVYKKGLGMQAPSTVTFNLGGKCTTFDAVVGPDDVMAAPDKTPSITFRVYGDGKLLGASAELTQKQTYVFKNLNVSGVKDLKLQLDPGKSNWFDRGDWADARVTCLDGTPATSVTASPTSLSTTPGAASRLTLTPQPADALITGVQWSVADRSVAAVAGNGTSVTVYGRGAGTTTLTATVQPGSLKVKVPVSVIGEYPTLPGDGTTFLSALAFAKDETSGSYGPSERDTEVGEAAAGDGQGMSVAGTSYERGLGMQAPSTLSFELGGRCTTFDAVVGPDDIMNKDGKSPSMIFRLLGDGKVLKETGVLYKGDSADFSGVDLSGVSTLQLQLDPAAGAANSPGPEWFDRGDWANASVTCAKPKVTAVELSPTSLSLFPGESGAVTASLTPADVEEASVTWESSDPTIATVVGKGKEADVTALQPGTVTITATAEPGGVSASVQVEVKSVPKPALEAITVNQASLSLAAGETSELSVAAVPAEAGPLDVEWSSSDPAVVSVSAANERAQVRAVSAGEATISLTARTSASLSRALRAAAPAAQAPNGAVTAEVKVTVTAAPTSPTSPTAPTDTPTEQPTVTPTGGPTATPTDTPTGQPTNTPTGQPTDTGKPTPTGKPTGQPTATQTGTPGPAASGTGTAQPTTGSTHEGGSAAATDGTSTSGSGHAAPALPSTGLPKGLWIAAGLGLVLLAAGLVIARRTKATHR